MKRNSVAEPEKIGWGERLKSFLINIFWVIVTLMIAFIPTYVGVGVHNYLLPTTFWQKFVELGILVVLGVAQIIMFIAGVSIIHESWKK